MVGAAGPTLLARASASARLLWPGARVLKTALAVTLAWWICQLLGQPVPIFAALAALQVLRATVADSLRHSAGQLLGMLVGLGLAQLTLALFQQPSRHVAGVVVLVALSLTVRLGAVNWLGTEVAVTAWLAAWLAYALVYTSHEWAYIRLWEPALGGVVAVVVNILVLPPYYLADAREALHTLRLDVSKYLSRAVEDFLIGAPAAEAQSHLQAVRAAVRDSAGLVARTQRAQQALLYSPLLCWSPLRRGMVARIERCARGVDALAALLVHARTASRAAWQASRRGSPASETAPEWRALLALVDRALQQFEEYATLATPSTPAAVREALAEARLQQNALRTSTEPSDARATDRAALLSEIEHVIDDLQAVLANEPHGRETPVSSDRLGINGGGRIAQPPGS